MKIDNVDIFVLKIILGNLLRKRVYIYLTDFPKKKKIAFYEDKLEKVT